MAFPSIFNIDGKDVWLDNSNNDPKGAIAEYYRTGKSLPEPPPIATPAPMPQVQEDEMPATTMPASWRNKGIFGGILTPQQPQQKPTIFKPKAVNDLAASSLKVSNAENSAQRWGRFATQIKTDSLRMPTLQTMSINTPMQQANNSPANVNPANTKSIYAY